MDTPSSKTARQRRARLIEAGHTYRSFAKKIGLRERTVKAAIRGERLTGKKTQLVLRRLEALHG